MTMQEFKAWFDGFTEAVGGLPTAKQWSRIKERVSEIDGTVTTYPIYIDRYVPRYPYFPYMTCNNSTGNFQSTVAMNEVGRVEGSNFQ